MFMTSRMKGWSFPTNEESRETKLCFKTQQECSMQMNDQQTKNVYGQQKDFQIEICNYVQNKFPFQPKAHTHHLCQRSKSKVIPQLGHESNKAITQKVYVYIYIYIYIILIRLGAVSEQICATAKGKCSASARSR